MRSGAGGDGRRGRRVPPQAARTQAAAGPTRARRRPRRPLPQSPGRRSACRQPVWSPRRGRQHLHRRRLQKRARGPRPRPPRGRVRPTRVRRRRHPRSGDCNRGPLARQRPRRCSARRRRARSARVRMLPASPPIAVARPPRHPGPLPTQPARTRAPEGFRVPPRHRPPPPPRHWLRPRSPACPRPRGPEPRSRLPRNLSVRRHHRPFLRGPRMTRLSRRRYPRPRRFRARHPPDRSA